MKAILINKNMEKKKMKNIVCLTVLGCALYTSASNSALVPDDAAAVVNLRTSCSENSADIDNCFASIPDLVTWIEGTRRPNESNPLQVNIGPGTYAGPLILQCNATNNYTGHISFVGSGSRQSIIEGTNYSSPIAVASCTEMNFSALQTSTTLYGGVVWSGGGNSKWVDVEINAAARGWYEPSCGAERGSHYWYSSKITATAGFTIGTSYLASCDESWFFGSEIALNVPPGQRTGEAGVVLAYNDGIIHVYGSVLRSLVENNPISGYVSAPAAVVGNVPGHDSSGGEIHIHGTGIDLISEAGVDMVALKASDGGMIHADSTAYNMVTTGQITRIQNDNGMVHAPYVWAGRAEAPDVMSTTGSDTAVVTNTGDQQPHLVVYSSNCPSNWYDVVTGSCR
ncbi:MAG: hypothetical protein DRQ44_14160 [Gammaproteobacteria bacterium]|nr:MAG: hypothetical protein DRQ44_14160 [Gammaproteobacteria bacterium]